MGENRTPRKRNLDLDSTNGLSDEQVVQAVINDLKAGRPISGGDVPDPVRRWAVARQRELIADLVASKSPSWLRSAASRWVVWELFAMAYRFDAREATPEHILAYAHARLRGGAAATTVRGDLSYLDAAYSAAATIPARRFLDAQAKAGLSAGHPLAPVITLGQVNGMMLAPVAVGLGPAIGIRLRGWTDLSLLRARMQAAVGIGYELALRPEELASIAHDGVELHPDGSLDVTYVPAKERGQRRVGTITRTIHADARFADPIHRAVTTIMLRREHAVGTLLDESNQGVRRLLYKAAAAAGIERFAPYTLRRSSATHLVLAGGTVEQVGELLRHKPRSTASTGAYVDVAEQLKLSGRSMLAPGPVLKPPINWRQVSGGRSGGGHVRIDLTATWDELVTDDARKLLTESWPRWSKEHVQNARNISARFDRWCERLGIEGPERTAPATAIAFGRALRDGTVPSQLANRSSSLSPTWAATMMNSLAVARRVLHGEELDVSLAVAMLRGEQAKVGKPAVRRGRVLSDQEIARLVGEPVPLPDSLPPLAEIDAAAEPWASLTAVAVKLPQVAKSYQARLSVAEAQSLRLAALLFREVRDRAFRALLYASGVRPGDLQRTNRSCVVRYENGVLLVFNPEAVKGHRSGAEPSRRFWGWAPAAGDVTCPIAAHDDWNRVWAWFCSDPLVVAEPWVASMHRWLFPSLHGMTGQGSSDGPAAVSNGLYRRIDDLGMKGSWVPYDARVTTVTRLLEEGVDLFTVAQRIGHTDPSTTQGYSAVPASFATTLQRLA